MRRKEKEIREKEALEKIITSAMVCRLGLIDDQIPYIVPLSFGYHNNTLYFHSASMGRKIDILKKNAYVCFEMDENISVKKGEKPCNWGVAYKSIIGYGKAEFIEDFEEKQVGLRHIMSHYADGNYEFLDKAVRRTTVFKVIIHSMTGKFSD